MQAGGESATINFKIDGMMCSGCSDRVQVRRLACREQSNFSSPTPPPTPGHPPSTQAFLDGSKALVASAAVDLDAGSATVTLAASAPPTAPQSLRDDITDMGFDTTILD